MKEARDPAFLVLEGTENIGVTSISDGDGGDSKVLSASSTEVQAASLIVMNSGLGKHGIVLELRLSQRRTVVGNENKLRYT